MKGSATIEVEKSSDGTTQIQGGLNYTSGDGKITAEASGSVDNKGNSSGKASVGINFKDD